MGPESSKVFSWAIARYFMSVALSDWLRETHLQNMDAPIEFVILMQKPNFNINASVIKWLPLACLLTGSRVETNKVVEDIDTVHVVFMNHLDVGYNGIPQTGFVNNVLNTYFQEYFPRAAMLGDMVREQGVAEGFIYTTHPWLASLYLNCPQDLVLNGIKLLCPSDVDLATFERAVRLGDITWHAGPMNVQTENMNEMLLELSLNISLDLDNHFGITRRFRTLSQRDIPGMTQAVLPTLVRKEVLAVSVGVNVDSAPPAVPRGVFLWKYKQFSAVAMWHPGGYPLSPGPSPEKPGGLSRADCVTTNSLNHALCFAFRSDNQGPPLNISEIRDNFKIVHAQFPGATVKASTFENFVEAIFPNVDKLPVYSQEIGDTWMMGASSDPRKIAEYRTISRTLTSCIATGECDSRDPRVTEAVRFLVKLPEHTYGLAGVYDNVNWTNAAFQKAKSGSNFRNCSSSWVEQRRYNQLAVEKLGDLPVVNDIKEKLAELTPKEPQPESDGYVKIPFSPTQRFNCPNGVQMSLGLGGHLSYLYDPYNQITWANRSHPLGQFMYRTYNGTDFVAMVAEYNYRPTNVYGTGIHKINVDKYAKPRSAFWEPRVTELYERNATKGDSCDLLLRLEIVDPEAHTYYGAPDRLWIRYLLPDTPDTTDIDITVQWFNKTTTRLPEALFYGFLPEPQENMSWRVSKIGQLIDPMAVGLNGSQNFHGIDEAVFYATEDLSEGLRIGSPDVPLVCPFSRNSPPTPLPVPLTPRQAVDGMAFNFYNNVWDTNFIFWYPYLKGDENFKSRFSISFLRKKGHFGEK